MLIIFVLDMLGWRNTATPSVLRKDVGMLFSVIGLTIPPFVKLLRRRDILDLRNDAAVIDALNVWRCNVSLLLPSTIELRELSRRCTCIAEKRLDGRLVSVSVLLLISPFRS